MALTNKMDAGKMSMKCAQGSQQASMHTGSPWERGDRTTSRGNVSFQASLVAHFPSSRPLVTNTPHWERTAMPHLYHNLCFSAGEYYWDGQSMSIAFQTAFINHLSTLQHEQKHNNVLTNQRPFYITQSFLLGLFKPASVVCTKGLKC